MVVQSPGLGNWGNGPFTRYDDGQTATGRRADRTTPVKPVQPGPSCQKANRSTTAAVSVYKPAVRRHALVAEGGQRPGAAGSASSAPDIAGDASSRAGAPDGPPAHYSRCLLYTSPSPRD